MEGKFLYILLKLCVTITSLLNSHAPVAIYMQYRMLGQESLGTRLLDYACATHNVCLFAGVSEVPDIRFIGHARNVTEAEGTTTICVISGQLADEIIPVNVTISTISYTARGKYK